ncbi:MAG TPA: zf-HC2 domain-containing protein [Pyrinomonadaceae bacterium]|jgi:hypothetical protein
MSCQETQQALSLYADDELALSARLACDEHLQQCPLCRAHLAETRALRRSLAMLERPIAPAGLASSISSRLAIEAAARQRQAMRPLGVRLSQWVKPWVMPYTIGSLASVLLFFVMFTSLRPHLRALREAEMANREQEEVTLTIINLNRASEPLDITKPVAANVYAALRGPLTVESPSLDPGGALATLTRSTSHGHTEDADDDMLVVTDVYSNGSASLASVMQAPRDSRMLEDFESALRKDPAFVPAAFDRRPKTMRVVFRIQKVDVIDRGY